MRNMSGRMKDRRLEPVTGRTSRPDHGKCPGAQVPMCSIKTANVMLPAVLLLLLLSAIPASAVQDVVSWGTNLKVMYTNQSGEGFSSVSAQNIVTTNYDFSIANTNTKTNFLSLGRTNWWGLTITNKGSPLSKP